MNETNQNANLNVDVRARWDTNAEYWDERMGEGNLFHLNLVEPAALKLLEIHQGEHVLEIACGNGQFARKLTSLGAIVTATDFSPNMVERARAHTEPFNDRVTYQVADATDETGLRALGEQVFDAIVCNMAIMDMAEIEPLFRSISFLLKPRGRFVFTLTHPCFNNSAMSMLLEEQVNEGQAVEIRALKLTHYLGINPAFGTAIVGQPVLQYYFDRPLHVLLGAAFHAGLVMDGLEEPRLTVPPSNPRGVSWGTLNEFPPVLAARLRIGENSK